MKLRSTKIMSIGLAACGVLAIGNVNAQDFVPSGNLWGYSFGDYAFKAHNDTLQRGGGNVQYKGYQGGLTAANAGSTAALNTNGANGPVPAANGQTNGFAIRRLYLGYDYHFAPQFAAQVVLANEQNADASGKNTVYVKYANVKWSNFVKNQDLVIGQYQTCSFATAFNTEPLWSYRSVERTILDMHNIDGSTDMGLSLQGKLWVAGSGTIPDSSRPNMLGYFLQVGNNNSAADNASNFKKFRLNIYGTFMQQSLTVGVYGDYLLTASNSDKNRSTANTTMKAYASYKNAWFRVGAEVFAQVNKNSDVYKVSTGGVIPALSATGDTASGMQLGWSVFASAHIIKNKLSIFARYDMYNPDTKWNKNNVYSAVYSGVGASIKDQGVGTVGPTANNINSTTTFLTQSFLTAGLDWTPSKRFHIMPNIWYNDYKSMATTTGFSGTGSDLGSRVKNDNDLVYRVTFYFLFNSSPRLLNNGMSE
jgi:hypothetical protein